MPCGRGGRPPLRCWQRVGNPGVCAGRNRHGGCGICGPSAQTVEPGERRETAHEGSHPKASVMGVRRRHRPRPCHRPTPSEEQERLRHQEGGGKRPPRVHSVHRRRRATLPSAHRPRRPSESLDRLPAHSRNPPTDPVRIRGLHPTGDPASDRRARGRRAAAEPRPGRTNSDAASWPRRGNDRPGPWHPRLRAAPSRRRRAHHRQPGCLGKAPQGTTPRAPLADRGRSRSAAEGVARYGLGDSDSLRQ